MSFDLKIVPDDRFSRQKCFSRFRLPTCGLHKLPQIDTAAT